MRAALVTGGTRGIGAAICTALRDAGHPVAATFRANEAAAEAFTRRTGIPAFRWDVADHAACLDGVARAEARIGPVEVLVNNAGITRDAMFHKMTPQQWREVIDTNLTGVFNMTHVLWPGMRARGFGRIVTISSVIAKTGQPGQVNYAAAKAGEVGLTRSLSLEGARHGITVNAVAPGFVETEMVRAIDPDILQSRILPGIPAGRLGQPGEIARAVLFLVSEDAGFVTGATIAVNGGQAPD